MIFELDDFDSDPNGFQFETFLSNKSVLISREQSNTIIEMQFGICISNLTSKPKRFLNFYLTPEILNPNSELVRLMFARNVTRLVDESNFELVMPGESTTFKLGSRLALYQSKLSLSIEAKDGGIWTSSDLLEIGFYQIRFHYKAETPVGRRFLRRDNQGNPIYQTLFEFDDLWTGSVSTSYKSFSLIFA